jgi:hypothetical protein
MINELKPFEHVSEIISAGSKNYAYKISNSATGETKTVSKVRDVTLNYSARHLVNFEVIKKMILEPKTPHDTVTLHTEKKIKSKRDGNGGPIQIISEPADKLYRVCFTKWRRLAANSSVPFGYKKFEFQGGGVSHARDPIAFTRFTI